METATCISGVTSGTNSGSSSAQLTAMDVVSAAFRNTVAALSLQERCL